MGLLLIITKYYQDNLIVSNSCLLIDVFVDQSLIYLSNFFSLPLTYGKACSIGLQTSFGRKSMDFENLELERISEYTGGVELFVFSPSGSAEFCSDYIQI